MQIASMNQRITLQSPVRVSDGMGGFTLTFTDEADIWAAIWPVPASEVIQANSPTMVATHRVRIRYRDGVKPSWRIAHGDKYYNIVSVIDPSMGGRWLDIVCKEAV